MKRRLCAFGLALFGCGGPGAAAPAPGSGQPEPLFIGTRPPPTAARLEDSTPAGMSECYLEGIAVVPELAGHVELMLTVSTEPRAAINDKVFVLSSSLGSRAVEKCLSGSASFAHGFTSSDSMYAVDLLPQKPEAVAEADAKAVDAAAQAHRQELEICGTLGAQQNITAWIAPGGKVLSVGVATPKPFAPGPIGTTNQALCSRATSAGSAPLIDMICPKAKSNPSGVATWSDWRKSCPKGSEASCSDRVDAYQNALDCTVEVVKTWSLPNPSNRTVRAQFKLQ